MWVDAVCLLIIHQGLLHTLKTSLFSKGPGFVGIFVEPGLVFIIQTLHGCIFTAQPIIFICTMCNCLLSDSGCFQPDVRSWKGGPVVWRVLCLLSRVAELSGFPARHPDIRSWINHIPLKPIVSGFVLKFLPSKDTVTINDGQIQ